MNNEKVNKVNNYKVDIKQNICLNNYQAVE
jgi:hypothetical protein